MDRIRTTIQTGFAVIAMTAVLAVPGAFAGEMDKGMMGTEGSMMERNGMGDKMKSTEAQDGMMQENDDGKKDMTNADGMKDKNRGTTKKDAMKDTSGMKDEKNGRTEKDGMMGKEGMTDDKEDMMEKDTGRDRMK